MNSTQKPTGLKDRVKAYLQNVDALEDVLTWMTIQYNRLYRKYCPVEKKKVVFSSYWGKGYGDNPK